MEQRRGSRCRVRRIWTSDAVNSDTVVGECSACGARFKMPAEQAETPVSCPKCDSGVVEVPGGYAAPSDPQDHQDTWDTGGSQRLHGAVPEMEPGRFEYHVELLKEGAVGSLLLGGSYTKHKKLEDLLNARGDEGWQLVDFERERRRFLLFFSREAWLVVFARRIIE